MLDVWVTWWFCAVQQWCWAKDPEQTVPVPKLMLVPGVSPCAQESSWFQITPRQCTDAHRPFGCGTAAAAACALGWQEGLWSQGVIPIAILLWQEMPFKSRAALQVPWQTQWGEKKKGFCSMSYNKQCNTLPLIIMSGSHWIITLHLALISISNFHLFFTSLSLQN